MQSDANHTVLGIENLTNNIFAQKILDVHNMEASEEEWVNSQKEARVVRYVILQSPQWFSELTYSSSEASIYKCIKS